MTTRKQVSKAKRRAGRPKRKYSIPLDKHSDRIISDSLGGEVAAFMLRVKGHRIECWGGAGSVHTFSTDGPWYGRLTNTDDGLFDGRKRRWIVWHHCVRCPYDMSWVKVESAVFGSFHQAQCPGKDACKAEGPKPG